MRVLFRLTMAVFGLILIISGLALWAEHPAAAQDLEDADYVGARECSSCHRGISRVHGDSTHALTLQNVERDDDLILGDLEQESELLNLTLPGEDGARKLAARDISFAVGSGRYVQRYLYEVDRNEYLVLPLEWNIAEQKWQPYLLAENWPDPAYDWGTKCAFCHTTGLNTRRYSWEDDGVQCESCHGPGSVHAETADDASNNPDDEELAQIRAAIAVSADSQMCGQCHSRGSEPDEQHPFPLEYRPAVNKLTDETIFQLAAPDDSAHWWATGHAKLPNMQFNEWLLSSHATSLENLLENENADDSCLSCHSSDYQRVQSLIASHEAGDREGSAPEPLTLDAAQNGITCSGCHLTHEDTGQPTNLVQEAYDLCTSCHQNIDSQDGIIHHPVKEMFEGVALIPDIPGQPSSHFTEEDGPTCVTCHMSAVPVETAQRISHTFAPILPGEVNDEALQDSCTSCHTEQIDAAGMQRLIDDAQTSIASRIEAARAAMTQETPGWAAQALDFVEGDGSRGVHNFNYADSLLSAVENEMGLASAIISGDEVIAKVSSSLPVIDTPQIGTPAAASTSLAAPSILFLGIAGLIILIAAYAFFIRRSNDE